MSAGAWIQPCPRPDQSDRPLPCYQAGGRRCPTVACWPRRAVETTPSLPRVRKRIELWGCGLRRKEGTVKLLHGPAKRSPDARRICPYGVKGVPSGVGPALTEALSPFAQVIGGYTRCDSSRFRKITAGPGRTLAGFHPKGFLPAESWATLVEGSWFLVGS